MNKKLKAKLVKLQRLIDEAIDSALSTEEADELFEQIATKHNVNIVLKVGVGVDKIDDKDKPLSAKITKKDIKFLNELGIEW